MTMQRSMKNWRGYARTLDIDNALDLIGLARRRSTAASTLAIVGTLLVGAAVGVGLGLMFAPRPGRAIRRTAEQKVDEIKDRVRATRANASNNPAI